MEQGSHIPQGNNIQIVLFRERGGCVFPFVTAKLHRLGVLRLKQSSYIPQGNDIQIVLFKEGECNKKTELEAPFFIRIRVVLVLGWRIES